MSTLHLFLNARRITVTLLMVGVFAASSLVASRSVSAQAGKPGVADAARIEQLMNELATMQAEMAKLKRRIVELERENADLKAAGAALPDKKGTPGGTPGGKPGGKPGDKGGKGDFAAVPSDPLGAPEAALAMFAADYKAKVTASDISNPSERQKTLGEVGGWARSAKKVRGKAEWTIELKGVDADALKGGGSIRFVVVDPVSKKAYSDLVVTQPISTAQMRAVTDKSDVKHWKLTGMYAAEPKVNKDLESAEATPMFIGLFAEMSTTLSVQALVPVN